MSHKCIKAWVSGRVQGVFFRDSTRREALRLGLSGYAVNLADGRVEVLACGEESNLKILLEWLKHGPGLARVVEMQVEFVDAQGHDGFKIGNQGGF